MNLKFEEFIVDLDLRDSWINDSAKAKGAGWQIPMPTAKAVGY